MQCHARRGGIGMLSGPMSAAEQSRTPPTTDDVRSALPRLDRHRPKGPPMRPSKVGRWRALALLAVYALMAVHVWHWYSAGKTLTPVEPSEAMQTFELGRINAGFLFFAGAILLTLVFGRWFCGWACHLVALQDLAAWLLGRFGLHPRPVRSRLLVLAPWLVAGHMFLWPFVQQWLGLRTLPSPKSWEWQLQTHDLWQTFPGPLMTVLSVLFCGMLIVWWLGGKGFCTFGCPYGAFFAVADRFAPLRIKVTDACNHCGHCTHACTSNVRVHEEVAKHRQIVDPGCMKCLDCVSVCPTDALHVGFAAPKPFVLSQQRIAARADFTWPEEVLVAAVAFVATEFVWRGAWFGESVPFLLAVALGVITGVFMLLVVRLVTNRDVTFQQTPLKRGGTFTRAGSWGGILLVGWLALTAHTFAVQRLTHAALDAARDPVRNAFYGAAAVDRSVLEGVADDLARARRWSLVAPPRVLEMRALALRGLGRHAEAEAALRDVGGADSAFVFPESTLALAAYCMDPARRRFDEARALVAKVLAIDPNQPIGRLLQQKLAALPK